jgi:hypothetical protein
MNMKKYAALLALLYAVVGCSNPTIPPSEKDIPKRNVLDWRGTGTVCHVHDVNLDEETIVAKPRLTVSFEQEFEQAMIKDFPCLGHAFGIDDLTVTHVTVRYCQKCREACDQWHRDDARQRKKQP